MAGVEVGGTETSHADKKDRGSRHKLGSVLAHFPLANSR